MKLHAIADAADRVLEIKPVEGGFELVDLEGRVLASGPSAKRLSNAALDAGAKEVQWNFDLKLAEGPR